MSNAKTAGMSRKTMGKIALLMAGILAFSAVITLFTGVSHKKEADLRVVTSFYPVYVAALNLTDGVEGVAVESLTQPQTGCLHDFQLSPENMIALTPPTSSGSASICPPGICCSSTGRGRNPFWIRLWPSSRSCR